MMSRRRSSSRCWTSVMLASLGRRRRPGIRGIGVVPAARSDGRSLALRGLRRSLALRGLRRSLAPGLPGGQAAPALLEGLARGLDVALELGPDVRGGPAELAHGPADGPAHLGQAPRAEDHQGQDEDDEDLAESERRHVDLPLYPPTGSASMAARRSSSRIIRPWASSDPRRISSSTGSRASWSSTTASPRALRRRRRVATSTSATTVVTAPTPIRTQTITWTRIAGALAAPSPAYSTEANSS